MGQPQVQQPGQIQTNKQTPWRRAAIVIIIVAFLLAFACLILCNLINEGVLHGTFFNTLSKILVAIGSATAALGTILTVCIGIVSSLKTVLTPSTNKTDSSPSPVNIPAASPIPALSPIPTIIPPLQPQTPQSSTPSSPIPDKPVSGNITGSFPPTDPKTIQQRQKLVEQVYSELTKPDINCIVLTGIGGIGKSTLAALLYNYAEQQRKAAKGPFTAEALWITVEESTATFAYLAETISAILDKPIPDFGKLPPQNQAAALFNVLNTLDQPCLIVINQFENLLDSQTGQASDPGPGEWLDMINSRHCRCRVLLTSRPMPGGTHDYPPTHMQECSVEGLETSEGVELLQKQGVRTPQATDAELRIAVARCAGHALSLELLASILRRNQSLNLHSLFSNPIYAQLWTGNIARKLLDYIYKQQLDDVQRQLLQAFSVYREPVPLEAAKAIVDDTVTNLHLQDALDVVLAQHLLQGVGELRYQLHAIIAEYAQSHFVEHDEQANKQALRTAHSRAAQYYLQQAETNCPPRKKRLKVDDVQPLVGAVWQHCQAGQWREAYDLMLNEGLFADLGRWGRNTILLELCQLLQPSQEWQPEPSQAARIYGELGLVCDTLGKKQEALRYYEQALVIFQEVGDRGGEGTTLNNLGGVHYALGEKERALKYFEEALGIDREVNDRKREGTALNNLGMVNNYWGKKEQALKYFKKALGIYREVEDQGGEGLTLNNLGGVYINLGKEEEALKYFEEALSVSREIGDRNLEGSALNNLGRVYYNTLEKEEALKYYEQALSIFREVGNRSEEGRLLNNLGGFHTSLEKEEEALEYYEQALTIRKEVGDRGGEGVTLNNLGRVYSTLGKKEEALRYYEQALVIRREVGDRSGEGATLWNIGTLYFEQGCYDVALASLLLAKDIFEEVQSPNRDGVQSWIDDLRGKIGEEQFTILLAQVAPQASQIVEQALREGL